MKNIYLTRAPIAAIIKYWILYIILPEVSIYV